jgi:ethanolamine utilization protein EutN
MFLGRVIGKVVATHKDPALEGLRLLVLLPIDDSRAPAGDPLVAADVVSAGQGETVYWVTAREAPCALPSGHGPVDAAIVGIADRIDTRH